MNEADNVANDALVITSKKKGVGRITLNRPGAMNALNPAMIGEIHNAVQAFATDSDVRSLLIDAAGRGFSAGGDFEFLDQITKMRPFEVHDEVYNAFGACARSIKLFPKPTVAAINGAAVGAGMDIALMCDFRIASTKAFFQESWISLGLITPLGGMYILPRLIGPARAQEMLMLAQRVDGEEAAAIGLVNRAVLPEQLETTAWDWAKRLADGPPLALRAMKEGIRRGMDASIADEWEHNVYVQSMLLDTDDFKEGIAAVVERRRPAFEGH